MEREKKYPGLVGIICSKDETKAYCVAHSHYHKKEILKKGKENETIIVYIPKYKLNVLIIRDNWDENDKFKWNIEKVLEYEVEP